jgi:hypothetical protein
MRKVMEFKDLVSTSSHLPILLKILDRTEGKVLELGVGMSTPIIQTVCRLKKRQIVSYESYRAWFNFFKKYNTDFHQIKRVLNWDDADIDNDFWDVVLVDHAPDRRRPEEVKRLSQKANYIILHDADIIGKLYENSGIYDLFKYRYDYTDCFPNTVILSNFKDLEDLK